MTKTRPLVTSKCHKPLRLCDKSGALVFFGLILLKHFESDMSVIHKLEILAWRDRKSVV